LPQWVNECFAEYAKRLPRNFIFDLIEVAAPPRTKNSDINHLKKIEGKQLLAAVPQHSLVVALDEHGAGWSTKELAQHLQKWHDSWQHVSLLIGGADGLDEECLRQANMIWSLSRLTFPHHLVRVIVAEQIYRAWTLMQGHPYHRA
jgi:23S rRNA (pseudouridine1915-N3)-methyltransferase